MGTTMLPLRECILLHLSCLGGPIKPTSYLLLKIPGAMNNKSQNFRARIVDFAKPIPIYREYEASTIPNFPAVTRMVQDIPTGMEKNEEKELHLIQAMDGGQSIPVPEVQPVPYALAPYVMPKQLINYHPFPLDEEAPEYDADSEDEVFLKSESGVHIDINKFEKMIGTFENSSTRKVLTQEEAKRLFPDDIIVTLCVYEYWLYKRLRLKHPLIPTIPTEDRLSKNTAYVAFRKRIDKRVTRRNRRNDENSYYRMLRLKSDLERAVQLLEMVKQREIYKKDLLKTDIDLLDLRYRAQDFNETVYRNVLREEALSAQVLPQHHKRKYSKQKKHTKVVERKLDEEENDPFVFRRKTGCSYLAPVSGGLADWPEDYNDFEPATTDGHTVILARRRLGRGGRIILDRRMPPCPVVVDTSILREIQSRSIGELRDTWAIDIDHPEDSSTVHHEINVPDVEMVADKEIVYIRGKKSFTEHLNEIRYTRDTSDSELPNGFQRICV